jgi:mono/diheme cytochrome c family protein
MKPTLFILLAAAPALAVDFDQDIRPLLQQHCVECHGEKKQKGELRLDAKIFAFKGGHDGLAIVAGDAAKSPLFQRITSTDDDERMPPKGEPLSLAQVALIKTWIQEGAVWPENVADKAAAVDKRLQHWSVQPVRVVKDASIDSLITAKLAENNLVMSPAADRRTLIRRLSFDLAGLPPTPERVEQFVKDTDTKAYEKLVDELLHSTHYGERWARHWLDIAHYADTHGFERDQLRPNAWRYRDYVIKSLNADKPYDQFIREQIAGDVIAPNDPQAVIATGFLAAGPWDFVGQVETKSDMLRRAARAGDLDDMVTQVITSTMGVTVNCARCHDHKLDPIKQEEYYRLWAVFAGVKRGDREVDSAEAKRIASEKTRLTQELAVARAQISKLAGDGLNLADIVGGGVKGRGIDLRTGNLTTGKLGYHRDIQTNRLQRIEWPAEVKDADRTVSWVFVPDGKNPVPVAAKQEVKGVPATSGHTWDAIRNGPLNAQRNTKIGGVDYAEKEHSILGLHANSGITFDLEKIRQSSGLGMIHFTAALGFGADASAAASRADFTVYVDNELKFQKLKMRKDEFAHLDIAIPAKAKTLTLIATDGGDGISSDLLFLGDARLVPEVEHSRLSAVEQGQLQQLRAQAVKLEASLKALPEPAKVYAVVSDAKPPVIQVQRRGNPEDPQQEVQPGAFAWARHARMDFGTNAMPEGQRRRMLAEWITHLDNPLTRRVLVNRLWHHHFGQGIVTTPSDFGLGGDKPSHPELLDWLADELLRSGWSLKHMHKLIVMSAAYRQQSTSHNDTASRLDAQNRLLWRQNPRRLDAESVHDAVLSVAGTLNPAMGGPGYRDFNFTEAYAPIYDYITPDKPELLRRSIYRFVVRTTPHQFMSTLDCPDPANFTPARAQTTTALQALTLSNNEFMLQQAKSLATRIENETDSRTAAIRRAFLLCLQREPKAEEQSAATHLVAEQGLFALCRMLINTNEFVYLD